MAFIEFPSSLIEQACKRKLEKLVYSKQRCQEYIDISFYNIHVFGKDLNRFRQEEHEIMKILNLCQFSDKILMSSEELYLLKDFL